MSAPINQPAADFDCWPVWAPMARRPWRLARTDTGDFLRQPRVGKVQQVYQFSDPQQALAWWRKNRTRILRQEAGQ